jgi:hypothetical protein
MRVMRRERYSPLSVCRTTLQCWDGIGSSWRLARDWKSERMFRGRDKNRNSTFPTRARFISPIWNFVLQQTCQRAVPRSPSFPLDLNGSTVIVRSAGKDHEVPTRDLVLAAHQLTDWSDCINDRGPSRVGHEALQWF